MSSIRCYLCYLCSLRCHLCCVTYVITCTCVTCVTCVITCACVTCVIACNCVTCVITCACVTCVIACNCVTCVAAGELSIWEFSGYEPYYIMYDYFIGDPSSISVVTYDCSLPDDVQLSQVTFWLHFIKSRVPVMGPICECHMNLTAVKTGD
jgi:hypothetical protein